MKPIYYGKRGFIKVKPVYYGERGLHRREKVLPGGKRSFINVKPIDYGKMGLHHRAAVLLRGKGASSSCSHLVHPVQSFPVQQEHAGAINPRGISKQCTIPHQSCAGNSEQFTMPHQSRAGNSGQFTIPHQSREGNFGQFTIPHQSRAVNSGQFTIPHQSVRETPGNLQYLISPWGKLRTIYNTSSIPCKKLRSLRNMIHALFGKRYWKGCETSDLAYLYDPGRFWLHAGRNGHDWP